MKPAVLGFLIVIPLVLGGGGVKVDPRMLRPGGAAAVARRLAARSAALGALQALAIQNCTTIMYIICVYVTIITIYNNNFDNDDDENDAALVL